VPQGVVVKIIGYEGGDLEADELGYADEPELRDHFIKVTIACSSAEVRQLETLFKKMMSEKKDDDPFAFDSDEGLSEWQGESENEVEAVLISRKKFERLRYEGNYKNVLLFETDAFRKAFRGKQALPMADLVGVVRSMGFVEICKDRYGLAVPDDEAPPIPAPQYEKGECVYVSNQGDGIIRQCSSIGIGQFCYRVEMKVGGFDLSVPEKDIMRAAEWKRQSSKCRPALKRRA
jgi:hypothetical protein